MGSSTLLFFAATLLFQAAFGSVIRGVSDNNEVRDLIIQISEVPHEMYEALERGQPVEHLSKWEKQEFFDRLDEVISCLEDMTNKYCEPLGGIFNDVMHDIFGLRTYYQQLWTITDQTTTTLKVQLMLPTIISRIIQHLETCIDRFGGVTNDQLYTDIKIVLEKLVPALRKLSKNRGQPWSKSKTFSKAFEYRRDHGSYVEKGHGTFSKVFVGEYRPNHGFHGYFKKIYEGVFDRDYNTPAVSQSRPEPTDFVEVDRSVQKHRDDQHFEGVDTKSSSRNEYTKIYPIDDSEVIGRSRYLDGNDIHSRRRTVDEGTEILVKRIQSVVRDVVEHLQFITCDVELFTRMLVQVLNEAIVRLQEVTVRESEIEHVVKTFKQIQVQLQRVRYFKTFEQVGKLQLTNALEQLVIEMEMLATLADHSDREVYRSVLIEFFNYITGVAGEFKKNVVSPIENDADKWYMF